MFVEDEEACFDFEALSSKLSFAMQTSPEPAGTLTPPLRAAGSIPFLWEEAPGKPKPLPVPCMQTLPELPGSLTPPFGTAGSIPFTWEEAPGKPRSLRSSDYVPRNLDLPPRLKLEMRAAAAMSSPTTVLDGPDVGRAVSFSFYRDISPEKGCRRERERFSGLRKWRVKGRSMDFDRFSDGYASIVFPSSSSVTQSVYQDVDDTMTKVKITKVKRRASFANLSHATTSFLATISGGLKQMVPWRRSRKLKKGGLVM